MCTEILWAEWGFGVSQNFYGEKEVFRMVTGLGGSKSHRGGWADIKCRSFFETKREEKHRSPTLFEQKRIFISSPYRLRIGIMVKRRSFFSKSASSSETIFTCSIRAHGRNLRARTSAGFARALPRQRLRSTKPARVVARASGPSRPRTAWGTGCSD